MKTMIFSLFLSIQLLSFADLAYSGEFEQIEKEWNQYDANKTKELTQLIRNQLINDAKELVQKEKAPISLDNFKFSNITENRDRQSIHPTYKLKAFGKGKDKESVLCIFSSSIETVTESGTGRWVTGRCGSLGAKPILDSHFMPYQEREGL